MIKKALSFFLKEKEPYLTKELKVSIIKINGLYFVRRPFFYTNKYFQYLGRPDHSIWWTSTDFVEKYCGFSSYEGAFSAYKNYLNETEKRKTTTKYKLENNSFDEEYSLGS